MQKHVELPLPGLLGKGPDRRHQPTVSSLPLTLCVLEMLLRLAVLMKQDGGGLHVPLSQLAYSTSHDTEGCLEQTTYYVPGAGHRGEHRLTQISVCYFISS